MSAAFLKLDVNPIPLGVAVNDFCGVMLASLVIPKLLGMKMYPILKKQILISYSGALASNNEKHEALPPGL